MATLAMHGSGGHMQRSESSSYIFGLPFNDLLNSLTDERESLLDFYRV